MTAPYPETASVPAGELASFGKLMEQTQAALAGLRIRLDAEVAAERERADRAEAELTALGARIDAVIAHKLAAERERADRAEEALSDALLRLAHGDAELHARLLADAGYGPALRCPADGDKPS